MSVRGRVRAAVATLVALATLAIAAGNGHSPLDIQAGPAATTLAGTVPLAAAAVAGYAVLRPRIAYLLILLLAAYWDMAQISWQVGAVQVIAQTIFIVALVLGVALADDAGRGRTAVWLRSLQNRGDWTPIRAAGLALVALLALALVGTALSPDVTTSATVLLHGILEPVAMGLLLFALRPTTRTLAVLAIVLAVSVALGGALNMVQTLPTMHALSVLQSDRLLFSRLTFFNVGILGEMLAMAMPLLLAGLLGRHRLGLGRTAVIFLLAALLVSLAALFLTFSKSAWLSASGAALLLLLLLVRSWRRRAAIVFVAGVLSTAVVPWPAFVLQVAPPLNSAYRSVMVSLIGESRFDSWNPATLSGRGSLLERFYATRAAVEMAIDHPLLGIGLDRFGSEYAGRYKPVEAHLALDSAHSMWAEDAAELGFPALACVLLIYAAAAWALWRVYRAPPDELTRLFAAAFLAALVAWLLVATAFAGDMYRPWRNMASDFVMMAVVTAAAFALYRHVRGVAAGGDPTGLAAGDEQPPATAA
jgi:O-antigen ligase